MLQGCCTLVALGTRNEGDVRSQLTFLPFTGILWRLGGTIECSRGYAGNSRVLGVLGSFCGSSRENVCFLMHPTSIQAKPYPSCAKREFEWLVCVQAID